MEKLKRYEWHFFSPMLRFLPSPIYNRYFCRVFHPPTINCEGGKNTCRDLRERKDRILKKKTRERFEWEREREKREPIEKWRMSLWHRFAFFFSLFRVTVLASQSRWEIFFHPLLFRFFNITLSLARTVALHDDATLPLRAKCTVKHFTAAISFAGNLTSVYCDVK